MSTKGHCRSKGNIFRLVNPLPVLAIKGQHFHTDTSTHVHVHRNKIRDACPFTRLASFLAWREKGRVKRGRVARGWKTGTRVEKACRVKSRTRCITGVNMPLVEQRMTKLRWLTMLKWTKSILSWLTCLSIFRTTTEQFMGQSMRLGKPGLIT